MFKLDYQSNNRRDRARPHRSGVTGFIVFVISAVAMMSCIVIERCVTAGLMYLIASYLIGLIVALLGVLVSSANALSQRERARHVALLLLNLCLVVGFLAYGWWFITKGAGPPRP